MPAVYEKMGIQFLYPENWTLDEDEALHGDQAVSVYSPGGSFWSVALHAATVDPRDLATAALKTLKAEYPDSEAQPMSETIGERVLAGYDLNFFYLDFTNTANIRSFRTTKASYLLLCQAEDREFEKIGPVFLAITTSLVNHLAS